MSRVLRAAAGLVLGGLIGFAGCRSNSSERIPSNALKLEMVAEPEGCRFLAAVEFERVGSVPDEAVRSERDLAGDSSVELKPVRVVAGAWDTSRHIVIEGSLYMPSSPDRRWLGILVADPKGQTRWFTEFVLRDGKIFEGGTTEWVGAESDAARVVSSYLKKTPITGVPAG